MGANEKVEATFHGATDSSWTEEDHDKVAMTLYDLPGWEEKGPRFADMATAVLDALAPRVAERERAARAEVLRQLRSGCKCIARSITNADPQGCYCDCDEHGYQGCDHEIERGDR